MSAQKKRPLKEVPFLFDSQSDDRAQLAKLN